MRYQATSDFNIKGGKGDIAIKAGQTIDLPEDKARTLIDRGKIRGLGIKWDTLSFIHLQTARQLAAEGVNFRLSTPEITQAEDALNKIWLDCLHGKVALTEFEAINQRWAEAIKAAMESPIINLLT